MIWGPTIKMLATATTTVRIGTRKALKMLNRSDDWLGTFGGVYGDIRGAP